MITRLMIFICLLTLTACTKDTAGPQTAVVPPQQTSDVTAPAVVVRADTRARSCEALTRPGRHRAGAGAVLAMAVSNDGGWCARGLTYEGYPFTGGNVINPPAHGEARVRHLRRRSVVEYRASPGYTGDDSFSVTMSPGNGVYLVNVTVRNAS